MSKKIIFPALIAFALIATVATALTTFRPTANTKIVATKIANQPIATSNTNGKTFPAVAVVELFTSEGCSSCPPADALLKTLGNQSQVFALALHVTYWDRLGWRDSVSQKIFDERQYAYSSTFSQSGVYTPQAVVNGSAEFVGSERGKMAANIQSALGRPATVGIALTPKRDAQTVNVNYQLEGAFQNAQLQLAVVEKSITTHVKRGENEGRTLEHFNVVRQLQTISLDKTGAGTANITWQNNWSRANCSIIAFVQNKNSMEILGATRANIE